MSNCIFEPRTDTTSATICKHCGREKWEHLTQEKEVTMSKYYSEEQVIKLLTNKDYPYMEPEELIKTVTPIELPTEEEINDIIAFIDVSEPYNKGYHNGWMIGAKWVVNKIKGGGE